MGSKDADNALLRVERIANQSPGVWPASLMVHRSSQVFLPIEFSLLKGNVVPDDVVGCPGQFVGKGIMGNH